MSTTRKTLSLYWKFTRPYKGLFWLGTLGSVAGVILQDIIPPFVVSRTFSKLQLAYAAKEQLILGDFMPYFIIFSISILFGFAVWRLQTFIVWKYELSARRDIAETIYDHLQHQSQRFHADRFGGALVSQTNKFMGGYERFFDELTWSVVSSLTAIIFSLGVLFFVSYRYALVLSAVIIIYLFIMSQRMRIQMPLNRKESEAESAETAALADAITNVSSVRAFANEKYEFDRFAKTTRHLYATSSKLAISVLKTESIGHFQTNSYHIIAFLFGLVAITRFGASASVLYLIVSYTQGIVGRLWQFGRVVRNINRSLGDASEMTEILGIEPEVKDPISPVPATMNRGEVLFDRVTFYYEADKTKPLFKNLSFKLKPGEKIGLVGHSGGGKTTVTRLLLRFMDVQGGTIRIDGQDISAVTQSDLRRHIAYVSQEPMLFHRSLMDNIRYGQHDTSDEAVIATAKLANAHEFISQLPKGYDTLVGERGVKLSGGQRQRVAIARAMLKNAPILVLDEATSALDSESEQLIQDALWKLMEGRTAIVIAHRLSTIQHMDRIIVLEHGKITEQGSHKELISQGGDYANLWRRQSGGFLKD